MWTPECQEEFEQIKSVLADERFLKPFDPDLDSELLVDTSKVSGAGYLLIQRNKEGGGEMWQHGSEARVGRDEPLRERGHGDRVGSGALLVLSKRVKQSDKNCQ